MVHASQRVRQALLCPAALEEVREARSLTSSTRARVLPSARQLDQSQGLTARQMPAGPPGRGRVGSSGGASSVRTPPRWRCQLTTRGPAWPAGSPLLALRVAQIHVRLRLVGWHHALLVGDPQAGALEARRAGQVPVQRYAACDGVSGNTGGAMGRGLGGGRRRCSACAARSTAGRGGSLVFVGVVGVEQAPQGGEATYDRPAVWAGPPPRHHLRARRAARQPGPRGEVRARLAQQAGPADGAEPRPHVCQQAGHMTGSCLLALPTRCGWCAASLSAAQAPRDQPATWGRVKLRASMRPSVACAGAVEGW